jgi:hypothetical protein
VTSTCLVDEFSGEFPGAASTLLADLLMQPGLRLTEVARTRTSVHYDTGRTDVPVLCVATPDAVLLPHTFVTAVLPSAPELVDATWRVTRWWHPSRPVGLAAPPPDRVSTLACTPYDVLVPSALLGRGAGLTPEGDDVLAGALVTAHATADPRLDAWCAATREAMATRRTTAVSRGMLHHALDGYATPQLADLLVALCRGGDLDGPLARLRALGHSSGDALVDGVVHTLTTRAPTGSHEGAA